ncbi:MAG: methyltransferase domain-containing protein [Mariprofundales bacterium]
MNEYTHENLKKYYGQFLTKSEDLQTNACCCDIELMPASIKAIIAEIADEVIERFYGCGSPIPPVLKGCNVLDLGCGTGRDAYIIAKLVGEYGNVIGVDMTAEQLAIANKYLAMQMQKFAYKRNNIRFAQGYIEDLKTLNIADNSIDVVISNCVINLSPNKKAVFNEIFRVLKPGGELYFSDVFADRRVPEHLKDNAVLHGECLAGALYSEDFRRLLQRAGFADYRVTQQANISINNAAIEQEIGMINFVSQTIRAFKIPELLEDKCEDYGQTAIYHGSIAEHPHYFDLDDHHRFFTAKPMLVCGNTAAMLQHSRYAKHWTITGDRSIHHGIFDCVSAPIASTNNQPEAACC